MLDLDHYERAVIAADGDLVGVSKPDMLELIRAARAANLARGVAAGADVMAAAQSRPDGRGG